MSEANHFREQSELTEDIHYASPDISKRLRENITRIEFKIENLIKKLQPSPTQAK